MCSQSKSLGGIICLCQNSEVELHCDALVKYNYTHLENHKLEKGISSHSQSPSAWCCVCPKGLKGSMFACWTIVKSPTDMSSLLLCRPVLLSAGGDLCEWEGNALIWWMSAYLWEYWWPMCSLVWEVIFAAATWQQSLQLQDSKNHSSEKRPTQMLVSVISVYWCVFTFLYYLLIRNIVCILLFGVELTYLAPPIFTINSDQDQRHCWRNVSCGMILPVNFCRQPCFGLLCCFCNLLFLDEELKWCLGIVFSNLA